MDTEESTSKTTPTPTNEKLLVVFKKPLSFEGEEIAQVDLSGLQDLKGRDLKKANRLAAGEDINVAMGVASDEYCIIIAHLVTGQPIEMFDELDARDFMDVVLVVKNFLLDTGWIETR